MYLQLLFCENVRFGVPYPEIIKVVIRIPMAVRVYPLPGSDQIHTPTNLI